MPNVILNAKFDKAYQRFTKHNASRVKRVKKSFALFCQNPDHPSLNTEKLKNSDVWSIRIDRKNRMFFVWKDGQTTAIFFHIGPHDAYKAIKQ